MIKKIFLIILLLSNFCFAQHSPNYLPRIIEIEEKAGICLQTLDHNELIKCHNQAIDQYNIEIQNILNDLRKTVSKTQYEKLIKSQNMWKNYFSEFNTFLKNTMEISSNPIDKVSSMGLKRLMFFNRAVELNDLLRSKDLFPDHYWFER